MRLRAIVVLFLALSVAGGAFYARWLRRARPPAAEPEGDIALPSPPAPGPEAAPADAKPAPADVQPVLDRLFDRALSVDREMRPSFVTGDFTGDALTDLAVAVRPAGDDALPQLNAELPRWRLQDATAATDGRRDGVAPITAGERLLAVVHGVAGATWAASGDRPCYLVRNAVGSALRTLPLSAVPPAIRMQVTRAHAGDVIAQERAAGRGLIFWTGAAYVWAELPSGGAAP
jgi:hypothetical protein